MTTLLGAGLLTFDQVRRSATSARATSRGWGDDEPEALLDGWHRALDRSRSE